MTTGDGKGSGCRREERAGLTCYVQKELGTEREERARLTCYVQKELGTEREDRARLTCYVQKELGTEREVAVIGKGTTTEVTQAVHSVQSGESADSSCDAHLGARLQSHGGSLASTVFPSRKPQP